ncbi:MAG: hypothetical protein LBI15_06845 [Dysgonamonadaceae bacterium]|jgi:hypothetical protein|nr:hypothetical protein [Dysgonamonadaceae bacterium]
MKYENYQRNHVIVKGREEELEKFLDATMKGTGIKHKRKHSTSSNSEDALTWSCFDILRSQSQEKVKQALNEILEDAFDNNKPFDSNNEQNIKIEIGKEYFSLTTKEETEVDASIETDDKLIFFEAKLYSSMSLKKGKQPYDQIANKLRVGLDYARKEQKLFYFIFLDIAPLEKLSLHKSKKEAENKGSSFADKWKSAWWFKYYRDGRNNSIKPLRKILKGIANEEELNQVRQNMGWLTWASLFKTTLRAVI